MNFFQVCDIPGAQLGALVGSSEPFTCPGPGDCVNNVIEVDVQSAVLDKAVVVGAGTGFTVGSSATISFKTEAEVASIPSGATVTVNAYAYTSIYFR